jgi:hypothetical protein
MEFNLYRVLFWTYLFFLSCSSGLHAQRPDLRQDKQFFKQKKNELNLWLCQNQLSNVLFADSVDVSPQKVTLFLRPAFKGNHLCDSIQCAWEKIEQKSRKLTGLAFHEQLLHKWAFLAEIGEDQAEIIVRCHQPAHFQAKIYSSAGKIPVEERTMRSGAVMDVVLTANLQDISSGDSKTTISGKKVNAVCTKARLYLTNFYKTKGTPILWHAQIDTSYTAHDEFVVDVTHLSYEICPDGYFEYHHIFIKGIQRGDDVELSWVFQGKYGSGILFPPRKNDYKDMETRYKNNLDEYQRRLFKKLLDYLRQ